jgi:hypothetical protein
MKQNVWLWISILFIITTILYFSLQSEEHFSGPSPDYITFNPKSLDLNPFGKVSQVMYNLQNPRDCEKEKKAVINNPYPTQEQVDSLFECTHNPYDRMLIKNLPFGKGTGA